MNYIERIKQERDELLRAQHACMIAYCTILSERIEYEVNKNV